MAEIRVTRLHARVRGRVQGVGYRMWTERCARQLGVGFGRVRNLPDGSVEVEAEAEDRMRLEGLLRALRTGPPAADVDGVEADWQEDAEPRFTSFRVEDW